MGRQLCALLRTFWMLSLALPASLAVNAGIINVDFDSLSNAEAVATQFAGMVFTNTSVLTAGVSLNESEFPPRSGTNVGFDNGGPMTIDFTAPVLSFKAYFTYLQPLFISAFNASNTLVGSVSSLYSSNLAISGDPGSLPNELLELSYAGGIKSISISGAPLGGSFVLDDVSVETLSISTVPEPAYLAVLVIGFVGLAAASRRLRQG